MQCQQIVFGSACSDFCTCVLLLQATVHGNDGCEKRSFLAIYTFK